MNKSIRLQAVWHRVTVCVAVLLGLAVLTSVLMLSSPAKEGSALGCDTKDGVPVLEIVASNLEYSEEPRLYHAVYAPGLTEDEAKEMKMLVYKSPQDKYTKETEPEYILTPDVVGYDVRTSSGVYEGCILFRTETIPLKSVTETYYYRAYATAWGEDYYSEVSSYSILDYIYARYESLEGAPESSDPSVLEKREKQKRLYDSFIEHANEMQLKENYNTDRLAGAEYVKITLDGASFDNGFDTMLVPVGSSVSCVPLHQSSGGYTVSSPDGKLISDSLTFTVLEGYKNGIYSIATDSTRLNIVGAVANGTDRGSVVYKVGNEITLSADSAKGSYELFYWVIDGKPTLADPSAEFRYTVPPKSSEIVIEALYSSKSYGAGFDDVGSVSGAMNSGDHTFEITAPVSSWVIADNPSGTGRVLMLNKPKSGNGTGTGLYTAAVGSGKNTVVDFDIYVADMAGSDILVQLDIGSSYRIEIRNGTSLIFFSDLHNDGSLRNEMIEDIKPKSWNNIRLEYYPTTVKNDAGENVDGCTVVFYLNGRAISVSTNNYQEAKPNPGRLRFWAMNDSRLELYLDNYCYYKTDADHRGEVANDVPVYSIPTSYDAWNSRYNKVLRLYGEEVAKAVDHLTTSLFTPEMYEWLAGLYDPKTGAFYYSNSARDTYGYLPDIESTGQSGSILGTFGASLNSVLNDEQKAKLGSWAQLCQSNEDGYFYHPQWGTDIGAGRRSRDLGNYGGRITAYANSEFLFDHANFRLSGGATSYRGTADKIEYKPKTQLTASLRSSVAALVSKVVLASDSSMPAQFASEEAFVAYLDNMWESNKSIGKSYSIGHNITSQNSQILAAGLEKVAISWLNARQEAAQEELRRAGRPLTGLWEAGGAFELNDTRVSSYYKKARFLKDVDGDGEMEAVVPDVNYTFVSGLLKISGCYNTLGAEMPYAKEALNSAIQMMKAPAEEYAELGESIVSVYNPPNATNNIMSNITKYGDASVREEAQAALSASALEIIKTTEAKIAIYRKSDGSFSYSPKNSSSSSQGEPAAVPGTNEGDVNGTALAIGARSAMLSVLGIGGIAIMPTHAIDINGDGIVGEKETHIERFKELICAKQVTEKSDKTGASGSYEFGLGSSVPSNSTVENDGNVVESREDGLYIKDVQKDKGLSVYFDAATNIGEQNIFYYKSDMRFDSNGNGMTVQLYVGALKLQFSVSGNYLEFQGRSTNDTNQENAKNFGTLKAYEWFNLEVCVYPDGTEVDGTVYYARVRVKQGTNVYEEYYKDFAKVGLSSSGYTKAHLYTLMGATPALYVNNVSCVKYGIVNIDGSYNFDQDSVSQNPVAHGISGGEIVRVDDPMYENNKLLSISASGGTSLLTAPASGAHNFAELQLTLNLSNVKTGEKTTVVMKDNTGKIIASFYILVTRDAGERDGIFELYCTDTGVKVMTLSADMTADFTLKLEYHYSRSRIDAVVRYTASADKNGKRFMDSKATVINNVSTVSEGAAVENFATVEIVTEGEKVYIDDVFARSVKK